VVLYTLSPSVVLCALTPPRAYPVCGPLRAHPVVICALTPRIGSFRLCFSWFKAPGSSWWLLAAPGDSWRLPAALGGSWRLLDRLRDYNFSTPRRTRRTGVPGVGTPGFLEGSLALGLETRGTRRPCVPGGGGSVRLDFLVSLGTWQNPGVPGVPGVPLGRGFETNKFETNKFQTNKFQPSSVEVVVVVVGLRVGGGRNTLVRLVRPVRPPSQDLWRWWWWWCSGGWWGSGGGSVSI
jgi:hypothetical protein